MIYLQLDFCIVLINNNEERNQMNPAECNCVYVSVVFSSQ